MTAATWGATGHCFLMMGAYVLGNTGSDLLELNAVGQLSLSAGLKSLLGNSAMAVGMWYVGGLAGGHFIAANAAEAAFGLIAKGTVEAWTLAFFSGTVFTALDIALEEKYDQPPSPDDLLFLLIEFDGDLYSMSLIYPDGSKVLIDRLTQSELDNEGIELPRPARTGGSGGGRNHVR